MFKKYAIAYAVFVGFTVLTIWLVRPLVKQLNIPILKDAL